MGWMLLKRKREHMSVKKSLVKPLFSLESWTCVLPFGQLIPRRAITRDDSNHS